MGPIQSVLGFGGRLASESDEEFSFTNATIRGNFFRRSRNNSSGSFSIIMTTFRQTSSVTVTIAFRLSKSREPLEIVRLVQNSLLNETKLESATTKECSSSS